MNMNMPVAAQIIWKEPGMVLKAGISAVHAAGAAAPRRGTPRNCWLIEHTVENENLLIITYRG